MNGKKIQYINLFLILVISLSLSLGLAYMNYYALKEADFLCGNPRIEKTDFDYLLLTQRPKVITPGGFSCVFWDRSNLAEHFPLPDYQVTFPRLKSIVLLC